MSGLVTRRAKIKETADLGDYLKAFACTAVMLQAVLSLALTTTGGHSSQSGVAWAYLAVKFTAPAFICGILFTTMRVTRPQPPYGAYLKQQWSALVVPTIWWTLAYLVLMPQVQQHHAYTTVAQFGWQFVNGNAAPHLWYNTMMLQIIVLTPIWWGVRNWLTTRRRVEIVLSVTAWLYVGWLVVADRVIYPTARFTQWYLLDRVFWGFFPYAILGIIFWQMWPRLRQLRWPWLSLALLAVISLIWQARTLLRQGLPVDLAQTSYYLPATVFYVLAIIGLIGCLATWQMRRRSRWLPRVHWLATYAYRAYLANVFLLQLVWLAGGRQVTATVPVVGIVVCYGLTWCLSFAGAYGLHVAWQAVKNLKNQRRIADDTHTTS